MFATTKTALVALIIAALAAPALAASVKPNNGQPGWRLPPVGGVVIFQENPAYDPGKASD